MERIEQNENTSEESAPQSVLSKAAEAFRQSHDPMPGYRFWYDPNGPVAKALENGLREIGVGVRRFLIGK